MKSSMLSYFFGWARSETDLRVGVVHRLVSLYILLHLRDKSIAAHSRRSSLQAAVRGGRAGGRRWPEHGGSI
jgi:hypothetical protein